MRLNFRILRILILLLLPMQFGLAGEQTSTPPQRRRRSAAANVEAHWLSKTQLWLRKRSADSTSFHLVDAQQKTIESAFDTAKVAAGFSEQLKRRINSDRLQIDKMRIDGDFVLLSAYGSSWKYNRENNELSKLKIPASLAGTLPVSLTPRPSKRIGGDTQIVFENRLDETVVISWNDGEGQRREYGTLEPGGTREQHTYVGDVWLITKKNGGQLVGVFAGGLKPGRAVIDGRKPDAAPTQRVGRSRRSRRSTAQSETWTAFCRNHNLWLRDKTTGEERAITYDGTEKLTYHRSVLRDRGVHMQYDKPEAPADAVEVYWSSNGQFLTAVRTHVEDLPYVNIVKSAGKGGKPELISYPYYKPGAKLPLQEIRMFEAKTGREIVFSNGLFPNPFELSRFRWSSDSKRFTFLYNERGHQVLRYLAIDSATGQVTSVCDEQSETFIDYAGKFFVRDLDCGETVWMSERDGWNHLYLFNTSTGELKNQITKGEWVVRGVERIDENNRWIYFRAGGIHSNQDPYHVHFCRINFDGTELVTLTDADGTHDIEMGPGERFFFDTYSRVDQPPRFQIRKASDGSLAVEIPADKQTFNRPLPSRFVAKGRDGVTDIHGIIHVPADFDATKSYPVIEYIYAGPHSAFVPKSFRTGYRHQHQNADNGFVVVQIDGMGTSHRSKAFHDVCWKNIADAGFPDRIAWMKAAAKKFPWLDLSKVGIYGGSAGGQNAMAAVLHHGDFYKVAVADCGCHDNRMDKIWWNELWMGWPVGKHYDQQSNVTNAHKLKGKLMLVVGEVDKNVDPASTMQVVNALIRANKDFEFLIVPGGGHGIAESSYGSRRRADFFVKHLGGKN